MFLRRMLTTLALAAAFWLIADVVLACPTCKDQLAHDPAAANLARGFYFSILFMLSMPYLILAGLGFYFYWEVRKARARLAAQERGGAQVPDPAPQFAPSGRCVADLVEAS